tara:strand:- start:52 stop:3279 length:3228 start_codon:yes stop_codon:yes gene_type:complete
MPLTRIKATAIGNDSITTAKLDDTAGGLTLPGTQFVKVPVGTTAQRPGSAAAGQLRFNTTLGVLEQYNTNTNAWAAIDSPPVITSISYPGSQTAADPAGGETITVAGSNFQTGATVTVGGTSASSVTVVSTSSITFVAPAKTAGDYDLVVTNANGLAATLSSGFSYNGTPSFTTAAGNIGTLESGVAMSTITIVAAEPDGGTLAFSVTAGTLPSGVSLASANGQLTGTPVSVSANTTSTFTVTATDNENQTNTRQFNLIVLRPVYVTQINQSLMLDGSASALVRTQEAASTTYTWSGWIKKSGRFDDYEILWSSGNNIAVGFWGSLTTSDIYVHSNGSNYRTGYMTRDVSSWYHLVFQNNAGTFTIWLNGYQIYSNSIGQALSTTTNATTIGRYYSGGNGAYYFDGYISDVHFIDGQAKSPTDFAAEYNDVWTPIAYSGTYGTGGYRLTFSDANNLGADVSGNSNTMSLGGIQSVHKMIDSPTINMATQNSLGIRRDVNSNIPAYYRGNRHISYPNAGGNQTFGMATHTVSRGKWYFEVFVKAENGNMNIGIGTQGDVNSSGQHYHGYRSTNGAISAASGSSGGSGASYTTGDVIGCAFDLDSASRTIKWYKNGTLQSTTTGIDANDYIIFVKGTTSEESVVNFGQDSDFDGYKTGGAGAADGNSIGTFYYAPPTGHLAICSKNIKESPLNTALGDQPEKNFSVTTWTGDNTNNRAIALDFVPDMTWIKGTNQGYGHILYDSLRVGYYFLPYTANGDSSVGNFSWTNSGQFTGASNFVVDKGTNASQNNTGDKYVAWNWKAGGKPSATNSAGAGNVPTAGSVKIDGANKTDALAGTIAANKITANTKSGFSIVQYTGAGNGIKTVAHGLNSAPEMIWVKNQSSDNENWCIYSSTFDVNKHLRLNSNSTASTPTNQRWGNTRPTSTVFTIGDTTTDNEVGDNGDPYIAYCWHSVPGFSKIGTYVGTGSANNGAFIYCGFKPAWIMVKSLSTTNRWVWYDNSHSDGGGTVNVQKNPILDGAELENTAGSQGGGTNQTWDFYGNGFRVLRTGDVYNTSGHTYMFMAFAQDSHKYAEGR